jgi:uncharacterized Zn finger protein
VSESLEVEVAGSTGNTYEVRFWREGERLHTSCSCEAGRKGMHCKHRLSLMEGAVDGLLTGDGAFVRSEIAEMLKGSDVAVVLAELIAAEKDLQSAQRTHRDVKKKLDRVMNK